MRPLAFVFALSAFTFAADADTDTLGKLSTKYETGNRGPATVSTGKGDPGGVSYGSYQLASKIGRADQFVAKYYPEEFKGLKGGSDEFTKKWKELAAKDADALKKNEHEFIRVTHYQPQVDRLKKAGLDVAKRSATFRDVVWSVAVHHGPNTDVVTKAMESLTKDGKAVADIAETDLIKAVYSERGKTTPDGKLVRFAKVSDDWIPGLKKRFENEQMDALDMLAKEKK